MGRLLSLLLLIYVIGIGVELYPIAQASWNTVPASDLVGNLMDHLPTAAAWPARVFNSLTHRDASSY